MSVLSYLTQRASDAVLSGNELTSINTSISTLQTRIGWHFNNVSHFKFGSSTRGTILPRSMDENSDIDYMLVFNDSGYKPSTYLTRLETFVKKYYRASEIYRSSPTIVLELNHIKFELVPATLNWIGQYQIPDGNDGWMVTDPNDFNSALTEKNKSHSNLIKPTIRLAKYWNAKNSNGYSYVYGSYLFEKWIVELYFSTYPANQREYLFNVFDGLYPENEKTQWRKDKIQRAKNIIANVRYYESIGDAYNAEIEVKKLIPA